MKAINMIIQIVMTFLITLVTAGIVTLLWNLIIEKAGAIIDWKTSFIMAIIIGIAVPIARIKDK